MDLGVYLKVICFVKSEPGVNESKALALGIVESVIDALSYNVPALIPVGIEALNHALPVPSVLCPIFIVSSNIKVVVVYGNV